MFLLNNKKEVPAAGFRQQNTLYFSQLLLAAPFLQLTHLLSALFHLQLGSILKGINRNQLCVLNS